MDQRTPSKLAYDAVMAAREVAATSATRAEAEDRDGGFPADDVGPARRTGAFG